MPEATKKPATKKKPSEHPTFAVMIAAAIVELKERKGSSRQAIEKYIAANYKVGPKYTGPLKQALKKGVEKGTFVQTKGSGASGSFKIAKPEPEKKAAVKKPAAKKTTKPTKKVTKKTPAKKTATKKTAAKKPAAKKTATKKAPAKKTASPKKKAPAKKTGKVTKKATPKKKPAAKKTKK